MLKKLLLITMMFFSSTLLAEGNNTNQLTPEQMVAEYQEAEKIAGEIMQSAKESCESDGADFVGLIPEFDPRTGTILFFPYCEKWEEIKQCFADDYMGNPI